MKKKSDIQIFLAHANEDKPEVIKLYERLKKAGYQPWLDKKNLLPGQNWRTAISTAIKESQLFIACLSQRSIAKQGFVQREFKMALGQYANRPANSIYLIPLRLNDCQIPDLRQEEYGVNLRDLHWLDYWEADGFELLERTIAFEFGPFAAKPEPPKVPTFSFETVFVNRRGEQIRRQAGQAEYFREALGDGVGLDMVKIPGGTFLMGTEDEEIERLCKKHDLEWFRCEAPQHEVRIPEFYMGRYPVTQAQWRAVASRTELKVERDLKRDPANFKDRNDSNNRPVERITWYDAVEFCQRLSKLSGKTYRLPSEAEWEYACRAGTRTPFHFGETITTDLANYRGTDWEYKGKPRPGIYAEEPRGKHREQTTAVGSLPSNSFGLYDMHGNVWEWCADKLDANYQGAPADGSPWENENDNDYRMLRGGSYFDMPAYCRSAYRFGFVPDIDSNNVGFRLVCAFSRIS